MAWRLYRYVLVLLGITAASGAHAQLPSVGSDGNIQVARYSSLTHEPDPALSNPLSVIATVNFPRGHVGTVGEAIAYLLMRTGYRVVDKQSLSTAVQQVMDLPLPESHRRLGPMTVESMLGVLLSDPYTLVVDRLQRTIAYSSPQAEAATAATSAGDALKQPPSALITETAQPKAVQTAPLAPLAPLYMP